MAKRLGAVRSRAGAGGTRRYYLDFGRQGKVYTDRGLPFESEEEADSVLTTIRRKVYEKQRPLGDVLREYLPDENVENKFATWAPRWLEAFEVQVQAGERSPNTLKKYKRYWEDDGHVGRDWLPRSIHGIRRKDLAEWSRRLVERKLSAKTRYNVMSCLSACLRWLKEEQEEIAQVPDFPWPRWSRQKPRVILPSQQDRVLDAFDPYERGVFLLMALCGVRPMEAAVVEARDIQQQVTYLCRRRCGHTLDAPVVEGTKGGPGRAVPTPPELWAWKRQFVSAAEELRGGPVFRNPRSGGPWTYSTLERNWNKKCEEAGVGQIPLYNGTKHSAATELLRRTGNVHLVQELLGHRDRRSTEHYLALANDDLAEVVRMRPSAAGATLDPQSQEEENEGCQ